AAHVHQVSNWRDSRGVELKLEGVIGNNDVRGIEVRELSRLRPPKGQWGIERPSIDLSLLEDCRGRRKHAGVVTDHGSHSCARTSSTAIVKSQCWCAGVTGARMKNLNRDQFAVNDYWKQNCAGASTTADRDANMLGRITRALVRNRYIDNSLRGEGIVE